MVRSIIMLAVMIATLLMIVSAFGHESINDPKHNAIHRSFVGRVEHSHQKGDGTVQGDFHFHYNSYKFSDDGHSQTLSNYYLQLHDVNNPHRFSDRGELYVDHDLHTDDYIVTPPIQGIATKVEKSEEPINDLAPDTPVARTTGLGSIGGKTYCTKGVVITHVDNNNHDPYFMRIYISNKDCGFTNVDLRIVSPDGKQKIYHRSGILSPQDTSPKQEYANNLIVLSNMTIGDWYPDFKVYGHPRYIIDSRHKKFRYAKGDSIELSVGNPDDPFFTYIDDTVPASPRLNRNIATTWADMKSR